MKERLICSLTEWANRILCNNEKKLYPKTKIKKITLCLMTQKKVTVLNYTFGSCQEIDDIKMVRKWFCLNVFENPLNGFIKSK